LIDLTRSAVISGGCADILEKGTKAMQLLKQVHNGDALIVHTELHLEILDQ
jgi:hypothetical protein